MPRSSQFAIYFRRHRLNIGLSSILGAILFAGFQNCSPLRSSVVEISSSSSLSSDQIAIGKGLYTQYCISCHNSLDTSTKRNTTAAQIRNGLTSVAAMGAAAGSLTNAQIDMIAAALSDNKQSLQCNPGDNLLAPQIKRLTLTQLKNSIRLAFGDIFQPSQFPKLDDGNPRLGLANDPDRLAITEINFEALNGSVDDLIKTILSSNASVSACVAATANTCFTDLIQTFSLRLWRRPASSLEASDILAALQSVSSAGGSRPLRMTVMLKAFLLSPNHLYRTEIGSGMVASSTAILQLNSYEIASLLSFSAWDSPPDDTLLNLAAQNQLNDPVILRTQAQRLIADPKYKQMLTGFIVDVLKIEDVLTKIKDSSYALDSTERAALLLSAQTSIANSYATTANAFMTPFTNRRFYINSDSARFFNQSPGTFTGTMTVYDANPSQRLGILSHPAFLTSIAGALESGIVKRGVFTIEQLMCNLLPPPPAGAVNQNVIPPGFDPATVTTREELRITHSGQATCISCHSVIDPVGSGFENFDSIGRFRLTEKGSIPIDSSGSVSGIAESTLNYSNSLGYLTQITATARLRDCMSQHVFKYISGQSAKSGAGACEFKQFDSSFKSSGQTIEALFRSAASLDSFTRRKPAGN